MVADEPSGSEAVESTDRGTCCAETSFPFTSSTFETQTRTQRSTGYLARSERSAGVEYTLSGQAFGLRQRAAARQVARARPVGTPRAGMRPSEQRSQVDAVRTRAHSGRGRSDGMTTHFCACPCASLMSSLRARPCLRVYTPLLMPHALFPPSYCTAW